MYQDSLETFIYILVILSLSWLIIIPIVISLFKYKNKGYAVGILVMNGIISFVGIMLSLYILFTYLI